MPCPTTSRRSPPSGAVSSGCGGGASAGAARKTAPPGRRSTGSSLDGFPNPASLILGQKSGSPSPTQGGSRMPESGTSGSVRGVRSNAHPYRDKHARRRCSPSSAGFGNPFTSPDGGLMRRLYRILAAVLIPAASLGMALAAVAGLVLLVGEAPGTALLILVRGALGDPEGIGYTLFYATDYVFAGLAVALPFQAGLFNIGGEGQAALGGLGATLVVLAVGDLPAPLVFAAAAVVAAGFGAAWAFVPALLQARRGSHLVITTIMFNFIAAALMTWLLVEVLIAPGQSALETRTFRPALWLPTLADLIPGDAGGAPLNPVALLALLAAAFYWVLLRRTPLGYEIRAAGLNPLAARAAGIRVPRIILLSVCGGGAFAGLIAINALFGAQHRLTADLIAGAGFAGIAVALMGRGHPLGIVLAAVLFGALNQGGAALSFDMPNVTRDVVIVAEGVVVFVCGALDGVARGHIGQSLRTLWTAPARQAA